MSHPLSTLLLLLISATLVGCGSLSRSDYGPSRSMNMSHVPDLVPKYEPRSRGGNPKTYVVRGKRYYTMKSSSGFSQRGIASWYGKKFHGRKTSNGETYNMYSMSAAHKELPIPTYLRVTNLKNGRSTVVRVNDRGPFHENRIIDLSYAAASKLGIVETGTGLVEIVAIGPGDRGAPPTRIARKPVAKPEPVAAPEPKPAAPPVVATPATNEPSPSLYLQVGAFVSKVNAEQLRSKLILHNQTQASLYAAASDNQPIYRVRLGPFDSVGEADRMAREITKLGVGTPSVIID